MQFDNPAGRLHEILTAVNAYQKTTAAREVWNTIFKLPRNELGHELSAKLAKTMLLPHEAVMMLHDEHPDLANPAPSWVSQVGAAFMTHNVHGTIDTFQANISKETLANIKTVAFLLQKGSGRKSLSDEELAGLRIKISDLLEDVLRSDQSPELKSYLVRMLRKILTAIEEYQLTGATAILESVEQAVGHAAVDEKFAEFLRDTDLGCRILDGLTAASCLVTVAVGLPVLTQFTQRFLGG